MKFIFLVISIVTLWVGTPILIIWEWINWWNNGYSFWVILSAITGIGWIPAWFLGIAHLFKLSTPLALLYLVFAGNYIWEARKKS